MTLSTYFYCMGEPFPGAMDVGTIFTFLWERIWKKRNFWVWEMILLHFLTNIKEMMVGRATSGVMYSLFPKVIITMHSLNLYTTWHFHKYGWPYKTSQTSRRVTSHSTSSLKGFMLLWRWYYCLMWRSCPWWSHLMVYNSGCGVVSRPNYFTKYTKMRFIFLLVLKMNCNREHFTHTFEWKRPSPSSGYLDLVF